MLVTDAAVLDLAQSVLDAFVVGFALTLATGVALMLVAPGGR